MLPRLLRWARILIYKLLVNGTPPSAISLNLQNLYGTLASHTPIVNYVRHCRTLIQTIGEAITVYKLAFGDKWE